MRRFTGLLLGLLATCWLAAPAEARWTASGAGTATAKGATLSPPTNLVASCVLLSAKVTLTWTASPSEAATGYEVLRGPTSGNYTTTASPVTSPYTSPSLALGTYFFTVRAMSGAWRSAGATEVSKVIVNVSLVATCV